MTLLRGADIAVVVTAAVIVGVLAVVIWSPGSEPQWAEVSGPAGTKRVALEDDRLFRVSGRIGDSVIEVHDGQVRFADAPCRNRVCIAAGWLARSDDFAACVPNGVSIRMRGASTRYDSINY